MAPSGESAVNRRLLAAAVASLAFTLVLAAAVVATPAPRENLPLLVGEALPRSGVDHSVTAVLLNFRGYDTLLEMAVLMVAVVVAFAVREVQVDESPSPVLDNPVLEGLLPLLIPLAVMVAVYLVWSGAHQPGGAFQAGALVAAIGILLRLTGNEVPKPPPVVLNIGLVSGFAVFVVIAVMAVPAGRPLLTYPPGQAGALILVVELALTLSISLILVNLFALAPAAGRGGR